MLTWQPFFPNTSNKKNPCNGDMWDNYNFKTNHSFFLLFCISTGWF